MFGPCFAVHCYVSFLVLIVILVSCGCECYVFLPHHAAGSSVYCVILAIPGHIHLFNHSSDFNIILALMYSLVKEFLNQHHI